MYLAPQPCQVAAQPIVHAFDDVRVSFTLGALLFGSDTVMPMPMIGAVSDVLALRNLRIKFITEL
jgi:hypothetical protein